MIRQAICLIALITYATSTSAQELIDWQEKRLTWDDFEKEIYLIAELVQLHQVGSISVI